MMKNSLKPLNYIILTLLYLFIFGCKQVEIRQFQISNDVDFVIINEAWNAYWIDYYFDEVNNLLLADSLDPKILTCLKVSNDQIDISILRYYRINKLTFYSPKSILYNHYSKDELENTYLSKHEILSGGIYIDDNEFLLKIDKDIYTKQETSYYKYISNNVISTITPMYNNDIIIPDIFGDSSVTYYSEKMNAIIFRGRRVIGETNDIYGIYVMSLDDYDVIEIPGSFYNPNFLEDSDFVICLQQTNGTNHVVLINISEYYDELF